MRDKTKKYLNSLLKIRTTLQRCSMNMEQEIDEIYECLIEYNTMSLQNDILNRKCQFYEDTYFKKLINERFGAPK